MGYIELLEIKIKNNKIRYIFSFSSELKKYFSGFPFELEYPDNVESVPEGVLAIPFVANVLPLIWLSNSELIVPILDKQFYESIKAFKNGFIEMYPEASFRGVIKVSELVDCVPENNIENTAELFSGGLDAVTTMLRHIEERPVLVSIWGSDIMYDNEEGWRKVEGAIENTAIQFDLHNVTIRSSFRRFDVEKELSDSYAPLLQRGWWYGVKHGIGIISHAAPYAYLHSIKTLYIASSNCIKDGKVRCASDPRIDNYVAFCGCRVIHDNYENSRQDKTEYLVRYRKDHNLDQIPLHVCWKSSGGTNCAHCEKCYRTMVGFWIAGDDPRYYGFNYNDSIFKDIYYQMALREKTYPAPKEWTYMKEALNYNWKSLRGKPYRNKLNWMRNFDFFNLESNNCRKYRRIIKSILVKTHLHDLSLRLRGLK